MKKYFGAAIFKMTENCVQRELLALMLLSPPFSPPLNTGLSIRISLDTIVGMHFPISCIATLYQERKKIVLRPLEGPQQIIEIIKKSLKGKKLWKSEERICKREIKRLKEAE